MDGWIILDIDNPPTVVPAERPPDINLTKHKFTLAITERFFLISYPYRTMDYRSFCDFVVRFVLSIQRYIDTIIHQVVLHGYLIEELHNSLRHNIPTTLPSINTDFLINSIQSLGMDRQVPKSSIVTNHHLLTEMLWIVYNHTVQVISLGLDRRINKGEIKVVMSKILDLLTMIDKDQPLTTKVKQKSIIGIDNFHEIKDNLEKSLILHKP
jgi:hypothetical protein